MTGYKYDCGGVCGLGFGVFVVGHRDTEYRGVVYNNVVI